MTYRFKQSIGYVNEYLLFFPLVTKRHDYGIKNESKYKNVY